MSAADSKATNAPDAADGGPPRSDVDTKKLTQQELADYLPVSTTPLSKAAKAGKTIDGYPVHEWAVIGPTGKISFYEVPVDSDIFDPVGTIKGPETKGPETKAPDTKGPEEAASKTEGREAPAQPALDGLAGPERSRGGASPSGDGQPPAGGAPGLDEEDAALFRGIAQTMKGEFSDELASQATTTIYGETLGGRSGARSYSVSSDQMDVFAEPFKDEETGEPCLEKWAVGAAERGKPIRLLSVESGTFAEVIARRIFRELLKRIQGGRMSGEGHTLIRLKDVCEAAFRELTAEHPALLAREERARGVSLWETEVSESTTLRRVTPHVGVDVSSVRAPAKECSPEEWERDATTIL